jgi:hypothetical protein
MKWVILIGALLIFIDFGFIVFVIVSNPGKEEAEIWCTYQRTLTSCIFYMGVGTGVLAIGLLKYFKLTE